MNRHDRPRAGALVAGTWLIGLGAIFLVRDYAGWSWFQAWPMFVVLAGFGMLVSSVAWGPRHWAGSWWRAWPIAWIGVGFVLLLSTTGQLGISPGDLISRWWPLVPIGIGAWFLVAAVWPGRSTPSDQVAVPLQGAAHAAARLRFGAGELVVGRAAEGQLVGGTCSGGAVVVQRGPGVAELEPDVSGGLFGLDRPLEWRLGVTGEVPLDLRLDFGAAKASLDLSAIRLRSLELRTGASETHLRLPVTAGYSTVSAETGAAALSIEVPGGVAARIRSRVALGSLHVDEGRFPRAGDVHVSPDWETATNRVDLDLRGGVGTIRVV